MFTVGNVHHDDKFDPNPTCLSFDETLPSENKALSHCMYAAKKPFVMWHGATFFDHNLNRTEQGDVWSDASRA